MITINATILAAGDEEQFGGFFLTGWEYLETQLHSLGINAQRGAILNKDVNYCMSALGDATRQSDLVIILAAPQPRTATLVAALLAKGLGLGLSVSNKARECVQMHADRVASELSAQDEDAFCAVPAGAVTLQNPSGFLQGYAITSRRQLLMVLPAAPSELQHSFASYVGELVARFAANAEKQTVAAAAVQSSPIAPAPVYRNSPEPAPKSQADTVAEVCSALEQAGITIAIAESGTSGALAQTLGSTPNRCLSASDCFSGKDELVSLDISSELISRCGTVSPQSAAALALAVRGRCATSLGVAITCSSRQSGLPPVAFIAVTDGQKVWSKKFAASGNAHQLKLGAVLDTLGILNLYARGSGLPAGTTIAAALDVTQSPAPVQSTGIVGAVRGKLSGMKPRRVNAPAPKGSEDETMAKTNLIQRLSRGKLTRNDKIRLGAVAMFLCIFVGSMIYIGSVFKESSDNVKLTDDLKSMFTNSDKVPDSVKDVYPREYQTKFGSLYAQNADISGWIKIDDTKVDYPVVQSADNLFYERKDFTRATNQHGIPFLDFRVDNRAPSTNTVIYAHNMNDGQMFGELLNYKSLAYFKANPIVQYDSVYRDGDYKIFGIVLCKKDDPDFNYHNYIDLDEKGMSEYVTKIRERSLINTAIDVRTDDELLTLSTCDYDFKSATGERIARFVVFARRVREGEGLEVDTSKATLNMNPVMPKEWYDTLAKQQETERKKHDEQQAAAVNKKWLTANELATLSTEEQKTVAASREADAAKYLTSDETSWMDIDEMVYTIKARKKEFVLYLTSSEQSSLSLRERISLSEDRASLAREWLSDDEIASAGKWSRIDALIRERQNTSTGVPDEAKWLTAEEIRTLSVDDKNYTISDRREQAYAAGVTDAEIAATKTWSAMKALIASKNKTTPEQYIKQNPQWLDDRDSGLTVDELKSLVSSRKQSARDAGLSSSEIAKHTKWESLEAAIYAANAGKGEAAQIKELVAKNPAWLSTSDASGKTLAQLQSLLADRHKQATDVGLDIATMSRNANWTATKAAIEAKKKELEGQAEATRQKYIADNLGLLDEGDKSLSLADMKKLADGRRAEAKAAGLTDAEIRSSGSWANTQAIMTSKLPPVVPPVVPPVDPPVVPPVDPPVVPPTDPPVVPPVDPPVTPPVDPPVTPPTDPPVTPPVDPNPPPANSNSPPASQTPPPADPPSDGGGTVTT